MENSIEKIKQRRTEALTDAKKHFNAADRKRKWHNFLTIWAVLFGISFLILNGIFKFVGIFGQALPWFNLVLISGAIVFLGIQIFKFSMPIIIEHDNKAEDFLAIAKKYWRLIAAYRNETFEPKVLYEKFNKLSDEYDSLIQKSHAPSTNDADLQQAQDGIKFGEAEYTEKEREKSENAILEKVSEGKVDALYEEKKHDYAAKRNQKIDTFLWILPPVIYFVIGLIVLLDTLQLISIFEWLKWIGAFLIFIAVGLTAIRTQFNLLSIVNGHERMVDKFSALGKKYEYLIASYKDHVFDSKELYEELENISEKHYHLLKDGHAFPTNNKDYLKAQAQIQG